MQPNSARNRIYPFPGERLHQRKRGAGWRDDGRHPLSSWIGRRAARDKSLTNGGEARRLQARAVTVDGVGDENAGAHDAEECGDCFEHGTIPRPSDRT